MKIGILTFHKTDNYGAMLQAYALSYYLKKLGHTVCFIDYCPAYVYKKHFIKKTTIDKIKEYIKSIIQQQTILNKSLYVLLYLYSSCLSSYLIHLSKLSQSLLDFFSFSQFFLSYIHLIYDYPHAIYQKQYQKALNP